MIQARYDRYPADEFRNKTELHQIFGLDDGHDFIRIILLLEMNIRLESHGLTADTVSDNLIKTVKGTATYEQNIVGIDLYKILLGVLSPPFGWNAGHGAFYNLQKRLLDTFPRHIPSNGRTVRFAGNLVNLIDIDDTPAGGLHIIIRLLNEIQDNVLHVLAHIPGFCKGRGVGNGERHFEDLREALSQKGLS